MKQHGATILTLAAALAAALLGGCGQGTREEALLETASAARAIIDLTTVPPLGSYENLVGRVYNVRPSDYAVAVYIRVGGGWWNKPTDAQPTCPIQSDRNWTCDYTTGGYDQNAERLAAFLVPATYTPPQSHGLAALPAELRQNAVAETIWAREGAGRFRVLDFSGREWAVKDSDDARTGPDDNYFSASGQHVWVDAAGRLHLKVARRDGRWTCAEVLLRQCLGHGRYIWAVDGRVDNLDPNVVLGLFTWSDAEAYHHREIDYEFSRWANAADPTNAQGVVQPWDTAGNLTRFTQPAVTRSTHSFKWLADRIIFLSDFGNGDKWRWVYTGADNPVPGDENVHLNLWLVKGQPPTNGKGREVIIRRFTFVPSSS